MLLFLLGHPKVDAVKVHLVRVLVEVPTVGAVGMGQAGPHLETLPVVSGAAAGGCQAILLDHEVAAGTVLAHLGEHQRLRCFYAPKGLFRDLLNKGWIII